MGLELYSFAVPATFDGDALVAAVSERIGEPCALTLRDHAEGIRLGTLSCSVLDEPIGIVWHPERIRADVDDAYFKLHFEQAMVALGATRQQRPFRFAARLDRPWRALAWRDRVFRAAKGARVRHAIGRALFPVMIPFYAALEITVVLGAIVLQLGQRLLAPPRQR